MAMQNETSRSYGPAQGHGLPPISEGMIVVDASNLAIGVVTASLLQGASSAPEKADGGADPIEQAEGANGPNGGQRLIPTIAGHFLAGEKLPELLFVRLQRTGFLRVERPGPYARTYYVTPNQIEHVVRNRVKLSVLRETLLSY